jgi:hypothetical protein
MLLKVDIGSNISMKAFGRSENTLMAESVGCGLWVMGYGLWILDLKYIKHHLSYFRVTYQ